MTDLNAIISLLVLLLIGTFIYGPWQAICTEFARQLMFEKRNAIFDLADHNSNWSFDNREYRIIRSGLERLIRFAHELTLPSMLFFWIFVRSSIRNEKPELLSAVDCIPDDDLRRKVNNLVNQALRAASIMMIAKSPITVIMVIVLAIVLAPSVLLNVEMRKCARAIFGKSQMVIQFEAERVGSVEDAALA
jgi:hypothetical protein